MDVNKTIIPPGPRECRRQWEIAWHQHIKQTLQRLHGSDDLFLDNNTSHANDKCTTIAMNSTNNAKHVAINSTHAQQDQPTIRLAQHCQNTAYRLSCVQLDYEIAKQEQTCQFCHAEQGTSIWCHFNPEHHVDV
jgi:hypothetical protein